MRRLAAVSLLALLPLAACGSDDRDPAGSAEEGTATLTVLAAASLTDTFTDLAEEFESAHEGVEVRLAFDSSATLAAQAVEGAPADVLATADLVTMQSAIDGSAVDDEAQVFATNTMVLVAPASNPAGISAFGDIGDGSVSYVVCVHTAPCGKVGTALLEANGITHEPASLEVDVKAVLAKVTADEADAGLVYATDAVEAGDAVEEFEVPGAEAEITTYPVARLVQASDAELAQEFIDLVLSAEGRAVLADAGFGPPRP